MFPQEIILHITQFLRNPTDIRNFALTNKQNFSLLSKYMISKEEWEVLSLKTDKKNITSLIKKGQRFIFYKKKIHYVYNLKLHFNSIQIMTGSTLISLYEKNLEDTKIKILKHAPYNLKIKPLKIY